MKNMAYILLAGLVILDTSRADTLTSKNNQTITASVTSFSNGSFSFVTVQQKASYVGVNLVSSVVFDSPQVSLMTAWNGVVVKGVVMGYNNETFTYMDENNDEKTAPLRAVRNIQFNVEKIQEKPLVPTGETIEKLYLFPEEYVGKKLVFSNCKVDKDLRKEEGMYALCVTSPGGKYVSPVIVYDGICFVVEPNFAKILGEEAQGGYEWINVTISCKIEAVSSYPKNRYIAVVDRMDIYNKGGDLSVVFKSPGNDESFLFGTGINIEKSYTKNGGQFVTVYLVHGANNVSFTSNGSPINIPDESEIVAVADGDNDFVNATEEAFLPMFRGKKGTVVRLKIRPKGRQEIIEVQVVRQYRLLRR